MSANHQNKRVTAKGTRPKNQRPGLAELAAKAVAVQEQVARAKQEAAETSVIGTAYRGQVEVELKGDGRPVAVRIGDELLRGNDVDMLADFVLIAMNDAHTKAVALRDSSTEHHLDAIGGLDLRGLGLDDVL